MQRVLYWVQWMAFRSLSLLPLPLLYGISSLMNVILYRLAGYRKTTVRENLKKSFPEKDAVALLAIEKQFYQWFCDQMIETIKTLDMQPEDILKRVEVENPELFHALHAQGRHVIFVGAHHGNWEWLHKALTLHLRHLHLIIYKPLNNAPIDEVVKEMREKFGALAVPMKQIFKALETHKQTLHCTFVLGDQSPTPHNRFLWLNLMNQPTAVYTGAEELARKYQAAVVYGSMYLKSRGHYGVRLQLVTDTPESEAQGEITRKHAACFEAQLKEQPAYWLWSHRRWKLNPNEHPAHAFA